MNDVHNDNDDDDEYLSLCAVHIKCTVRNHISREQLQAFSFLCLPACIE